MILDDADGPAVEQGRYSIAYGEMVDGYRHAYEAPVGKYGHRTIVRYSRSASHPPDPRCPECHPLTSDGGDRSVCPECANGKHINCIAEALNEKTDELVPCECLCGGGRR